MNYKYARVSCWNTKSKYWVRYTQVSGEYIHASAYSFRKENGEITEWLSGGSFPFKDMQFFQVIKYKNLPKELKG